MVVVEESKEKKASVVKVSMIVGFSCLVAGFIAGALFIGKRLLTGEGNTGGNV
jgi:DMSO reductase anchor subunit